MAHLGRHKNIDLLEPIRILTRQYIELYPGRNWLRDLETCEDNDVYDIFYAQVSPRAEVLRQLSMLHRFTTKKMAKAVLGVAPTSTLYECPNCLRDSEYDHQGYSVASMERKRLSLQGTCPLCGNTFQMVRKKCTHCRCDVIFADGDDKDSCCNCGKVTDP